MGNTNCVIISIDGRIFGIHTDILGFLFYITISLIAASLVIGVSRAEWWHLAANVMIAGGVLSSLALLFIQWKVIRAWCFWCVMSAITIFVMTIVILTGDLLTTII